LSRQTEVPLAVLRCRTNIAEAMINSGKCG
jgi:hypothetical protein